MAKRTRQQNLKRAAEARMHRELERREAMEEFEANILPKLRKMIAAGKSAQEIYEFAQAMAAARTVTIIAQEVDSGKALAAVKEVLDRTQGKAKERIETEHKFSKLKEEELDALLASELAGVGQLPVDESASDDDQATEH